MYTKTSPITARIELPIPKFPDLLQWGSQGSEEQSDLPRHRRNNFRHPGLRAGILKAAEFRFRDVGPPLSRERRDW